MKRIFNILIIIFLFCSVGSVLAVPDMPSLVRLYGIIEGPGGDMANCNLLNTASISVDGTDATYTSAVGFSGDRCYYSIDVLASDISEGDVFEIIVAGVSSSEQTYSGNSPEQANIVVALDDAYFVFVNGCMDASADNYDADANFDDGTCEYSGCVDQDAYNYDASATTDDGSCLYPGCTDPNANNYDPDANMNSGCTYDDPELPPEDEEIYGCVESSAINYNPEATDDDGSCIFPDPDPIPILGCTDIAAENYDASATDNDGSCTYADVETDDGSSDDSHDSSSSSSSSTSSSSSSKNAKTTSTPIDFFPEDDEPETATDDQAEIVLDDAATNTGVDEQQTQVQTAPASAITGNTISSETKKKTIPVLLLIGEMLIAVVALLTAVLLFGRRNR